MANRITACNYHQFPLSQSMRLLQCVTGPHVVIFYNWLLFSYLKVYLNELRAVLFEPRSVCLSSCSATALAEPRLHGK